MGEGAGVCDPCPPPTNLPPLLTHRALAAGAYHAAVAGRVAVFDLGLRRLPGGFALSQFRVVHHERQGLGRDVDLDAVSLLNKSNGAALCGLRRNMADGRAPGAAAKAAVG